MHAGHHYSLREVAIWTRRETLVFVALATIPTVLHESMGWTFLAIPWLPIALVGTAVAFMTGFKNNASYARAWEARQIWGGIVNSSRSWAIMALDVPRTDDAVRTRLVHRHLAWVTALRFQLREHRKWEAPRPTGQDRRWFRAVEQDTKLETALEPLLSAEERARVLPKSNRAVHLIREQSRELALLRQEGKLGEQEHVAMQRLLSDLYEHQGKCERIKNYPYPRQFATLNLFFTWLFIGLVPFGLLGEFDELGLGVWLTIPAGIIVAWVFHTMDKIGEASENPFEGGANDVPITSLSRTLEIDLRQMLGEANVPPPLTAENDILM